MKYIANNVYKKRKEGLSYHDKSMSEGQVINFRDWPNKLSKETNLEKYMSQFNVRPEKNVKIHINFAFFFIKKALFFWKKKTYFFLNSYFKVNLIYWKWFFKKIFFVFLNVCFTKNNWSLENNIIFS